MPSDSPQSETPSGGKEILLWLAIVPAVIGVWAFVWLMNVVFALIFEFFGRKAGPDDFSIAPVVISAVGGYGMVMVVQMIAPRAKNGVAVFFGLIVALIGCISIYNGVGFIPRLIDIAMTGGALFGVYSAYNDNTLELPN